MQIFVSGGAGFIGSHCVAAALAAGHTVRVLDNLSSGDRANLPPGVPFTVGDVTDPTAVAAALAGCDAVLHLAALVSVPQSMREPDATFQINAAGTATVLEAARQAGIRRFVLASTCAVYGDLPGVHDETSPTQPLSPYAASKLAAETWAGVYARAYGMQTVIFRYFNVYGPRQRADSPYSGVIARWCTAASTGEPCRIFGDGSQTRDFVSVHDIAAANLVALTRSPAHPLALTWGDVYTVATGRSVSLNELLDDLQRAAGHPLERAYAPARTGDILHSAGRSTRLQALGWRAQTPLVEGLAELLHQPG